MSMSVSIITIAARPYRSRRARRQAFYRRQQIARFLARLVNAIDTAAIDEAYCEALYFGTGFVKVQSQPPVFSLLSRSDVYLPRRSWGAS
jgi:hypothetical protein